MLLMAQAAMLSRNIIRCARISSEFNPPTAEEWMHLNQFGHAVEWSPRLTTCRARRRRRSGAWPHARSLPPSTNGTSNDLRSNTVPTFRRSVVGPIAKPAMPSRATINLVTIEPNAGGDDILSMSSPTPSSQSAGHNVEIANFVAKRPGRVVPAQDLRQDDGEGNLLSRRNLYPEGPAQAVKAREA